MFITFLKLFKCRFRICSTAVSAPLYTNSLNFALGKVFFQCPSKSEFLIV